jgi:hypothetical protein
VPPRTTSSNQWPIQDARAQLSYPPANVNTSLPNVVPLRTETRAAGTSRPSPFEGNSNDNGTRSPLSNIRQTRQPAQDPWGSVKPNPNPISSRTPNEATLGKFRAWKDVAATCE